MSTRFDNDIFFIVVIFKNIEKLIFRKKHIIMSNEWYLRGVQIIVFFFFGRLIFTENVKRKIV